MKTRNKFGNRKTEYRNCLYDSKKEADYAAELDIRALTDDKDLGILSWQRQVHIEILVNKVHICTCIVDFLVYHADGSMEFIEVKGYSTDVFKLKKKLIERIWLPEHPNCRYTVV